MSTRYVVVKNKVWLEVMYKETPIGTRCVYTGKTRKDCQNWLEKRGN